METKEKNIPKPELKDEELDEVAGGVMRPGQPTPPPDRPDPILDNPNAFTDKPGQPDKAPKFF